MALTTPPRPVRRPAAPSRRAFRHATQLGAAPAWIEIVAAVRRARERRGRQWEWDARIESSASAALAYLYRRGHGEKWAGAGGSATFACSLAQLIAGLAPIMGWRGTPQQLLRTHRRSVQRWLDWLQDAGLVIHQPQQDEEGWWWRTIITLRPLPAPDEDLLKLAAERMGTWAAREQRRRARGLRRPAGRRLRDLTLILSRARLSASQRRARAVERRRRCAEHSVRAHVRAKALESMRKAGKGHLPQPCGAWTTSQVKNQGNHNHDESHSSFTHAHGRAEPSTPTSDQRQTAGTERDPELRARSWLNHGTVGAENYSSSEASYDGAGGESDASTRARRSACEPEELEWRIAREVFAIWRSRSVHEWQPLLDAVARRSVEIADWPAGTAFPRWRLLEAWTAIAWGPTYAAAGGAVRLPLWRERRNDSREALPEWLANEPHRNGRRLDGAIARYEHHSQHRPDGWPDGGLAALVHFIALQHPEPGESARCLAYDVQSFSRITKQLAAYGKTRDPEWLHRATRRARKRQSRAGVLAARLNFRLPAARLRLASELLPLPRFIRRHDRLAERDRRLLAGQLPLEAGTLRAAWAYEDRWLR